MSVRHFTTQFCPDCQKDTMHFVSKCRECGHVNSTPFEMRKNARMKSAMRRKIKGLPFSALLPVRAKDANEAKELLEAVRIGRAKDTAVTAQRLLSIASTRKSK
jgi:ribosomal protein L44E